MGRPAKIVGHASGKLVLAQWKPAKLLVGSIEKPVKCCLKFNAQLTSLA